MGVEFCRDDLETYKLLLEHVMFAAASLYNLLLFQVTHNLPQRLAHFLHHYARSLSSAPDNGWVRTSINLTHEKLGILIGASRVTTTLLLNHLERLEALRQTPKGLSCAAWFLEPKFILTELHKKKWTALRQKN